MELLLEGELDRDLVMEALLSLKPKNLGFFGLRRSVVRTPLHALYWMVSYYDAERQELIDFVSEEKYYQSFLLKSEGCDRLDLIFRLQTVGLSGYTQYGIFVRRYGENFACWE